MFFFLATLIVITFMAMSNSEWYDRNKNIFNASVFFQKFTKYFVICFTVAFLLTVSKDSVVIVPAGHRGVIFDKLNGIRPAALNEGLNFVMPLIQQAVLIDTRVQKVEFESTAASKDLQSVRTKVALNFRPKAETVPDLYRNFGLDYAEKVIHPAVQEAVKATTALYTAEELITRREEVKNHIQQLLRQQTTTANLEIAETYITDFEFSSEFAHAVESKQIAEQQAFKARRDLERVKIEAEQKVAQARAEAQSLSMQREAITSNLIELRRIEAQREAIGKWNGQLPDVMMGGGSTPFIDISQFTRKSQ